jgi:ankyrin repeat protein
MTGALEEVRALLAAQVDPNAEAEDNITALYAAAFEGHAEVVVSMPELQTHLVKPPHLPI